MQVEEEIVVDVILETRPDGSKSSTLPLSVMNNSILSGRKLTTHFVTELSYFYDEKAFVWICQEFGLDEKQREILKQLIDLNSGYIDIKLLSQHFEIGVVLSIFLTDTLVFKKQACFAPKDRKLYSLPEGKRLGGEINSRPSWLNQRNVK